MPADAQSSQYPAPAPAPEPQMSSNQPPAGSNAAPSSQLPGHASFRRQRASRACQTCPCQKGNVTQNPSRASHCRAAPTRPRRKQSTNDHLKMIPRVPIPRGAQPHSTLSDGTPATSLTEAQNRQREHDENTYAQFMKPKFTRAPIKEAEG
ncbi:hypothetical protein EYC84_011294 [Monilinia fructicola]|uniref:Uncharacterized protein n=1 Tax=Monilinia fructicola TaxID=38448 RepID=A0A5M9J775_MONFR|nr:hypothetical protein EYC84_011294 [Monilinia fructicola]